MTATRQAPAYVFFGLGGWVGGAVISFVQVALADSLSRAQVSLAEVGGLISAAFLPITFMVLWAPLVDSRGRRRGWALVGTVLATGATAMAELLPHDGEHLSRLTALVVVAAFGYSLLTMSAKRLVVETLPPERRSVAAGWISAGASAGYAMAALVLELESRLSRPGVALAVALGLSLPPLAALWRLRGCGGDAIGAPAAVGAVARATWRLVGTHAGRLAVAICVLPVGLNAAGMLAAALGSRYGAGAELVGTATGMGNAIAASGGGIAFGYLCVRTGTRAGWALSGAGLVLVSVLATSLPATPAAYVAIALAWFFFQGASQTACVALMLKMIEPAAAATQSALFLGMMNAPNLYLPPLGGWLFDRLGLRGLLWADAAIGAAGLAAYVLLSRGLRQTWWRDPLPAA